MTAVSSPSSPQNDIVDEIADLDIVLAIDARISTVQESQRIMEILLEEGLKIVGGDNGDISRYEAQSNKLELVCARGPLKDTLPKETDASQGISGRALRDKATQVIADVLDDLDYQALCDQHPPETPYGHFLRSFRSTVKIPLLVNESPVGIFCIHSSVIDNFSKRKVKLLEVLLRRATSTLHMMKLHEETLSEAWERAADIFASLGIGELLVTGAPLSKLKQHLYDASAHKAVELTGARSANLRLLNAEKQHLWFAGMAGDGWTEEIRNTIYPLDSESAATWALQERKTQYIEERKPGVHFLPLFSWAQSHVSVPLIDRSGRALGVLSVTSDRPYAFKGCIAVLEHLARTTILSLGQVELIDRLSLQILGQHLEGVTTIDELCDQATQEVCKRLPATAGSLFLLDPQKRDYVLQATTGLQRSKGEHIAYAFGEGLTGWVVKHKRSLRLKDCQDKEELKRIAADLRWLNKFREDKDIDPHPHPFRYLGAPLLVGNEVIGVIRITYREGNQEFSEADGQWLSLAAGFIALAIERLQLRQESKQRITAMGILYQFSKIESSDVDEILHKVLHQGVAQLGCRNGHIRLREKNADQLLLYDTFGDYKDHSPMQVRQYGEGISGWIAMNKKSWFAENSSRIGVPLMVDQQILGTLVIEKEAKQAFSTIELHVLESIAAMAASAVRKRWLFEGLSHIAGAIVDVKTTTDLYKLMYEQVQCLIPTDAFYIALYDASNKQWEFPYMVERGKSQWRVNDIRRTENSYLLNAAAHEKRASWIRRQDQETLYSASSLFAPILLPGDKLMGVLSVQCKSPDAYTQEHLHILATITSQASGAIQGVEQLQKVRTFAEVRERIYRAGATGDFRELLEAVLQSAKELTKYPRGIIRLVDERYEFLILAASYGIDIADFPPSRPVAVGIIGQAVTSKEPQSEQDAHKHQSFQRWYHKSLGTSYQRFLNSLKGKPIIAVPLLVKGEPIGVLAMYGGENTILHPEDVINLQKVAEEAALPIHYATLNAKARLLGKMTEHFENLLKNGNDEEAVLKDALQYALEHTSCKHGHISSLDLSEKWLIKRAYSEGYLRDLPERQEAAIGVHGRTLHTDRTKLITNLQLDKDYEVYLASFNKECSNFPKEMKELDTIIVVPIQRQGILYGILCLHDPPPNVFTTVQMALMDKLGNYIGTLISQAREAQELQRLALRAELGDLAAFVAHEVNTPLGIISMKAERLLNKVPDELQREKLQEILFEVERGARIVDELLDYAGRQHGQEKACDLNIAITQALRLMESLPERKPIQLKLEQQAVPRVAMGANQVKQIFFNLVRNAVDAMPQGGVLTVQTDLTSDQKWVELRVSDTGTGILPELRKKIFDLYFTTKEHGTGLGLFLCRRLAREQGGDIRVESEQDKGSTFVVTLPVEE